MRVEQVMTQPVVTCRADETVNAAARLMWDEDCGSVPVVDAAGRAIGMITDRDVCMAAYTRGKTLSELPVVDAMSRELHSCHPEDSIDVAQAIMRRAQVRRLPVLDDQGEVVGLISLNDITIEIARERGQPRPELSVHELSYTLFAICKHRDAAAIARGFD